MFHYGRPCEAAEPLVFPAAFPGSGQAHSFLTLRRLKKTFGPHAAVDDVSLEVPKGSVFGIIGRSGAGKSSLLRMAALVERPDAGEVLYEGADVSRLNGPALRAARRRVGVVPQSFDLFPSRTAAGNVAFPLENAHCPRRLVAEHAETLLDLVGLADKAARPVSRLSDGERWRVALARALALEPDILFLDEATSSLDPETTGLVLDLLWELKDGLGLTVVMATRQMEVVRRLCESVALLDAGRLAGVLPVDECFAERSGDIVRRFVIGELRRA
jgi:D-methionine transport system ATP-binding protein